MYCTRTGTVRTVVAIINNKTTTVCTVLLHCTVQYSTVATVAHSLLIRPSHCTEGRKEGRKEGGSVQSGHGMRLCRE